VTRFVLAIVVVGCGEDARHRPDAGPTEDAGTDAGSEPRAPAAPALAPCPPGWREVPDAEVDGLVACDPWPASGHEDCTGAQAHFPGGDGCERIGTACPAGDFPEDLPVGEPVVYVRAGEPGGGDGTVDAPFGSIADAIAATPGGAIVALSRGTFTERVVLGRAHTLRGACVDGTTIEPPGPDDTQGTIEMTGRGGSAVENLRVTGPRSGIWVYGNAEPVTIDSVLVEDAAVGGVWVGGPTAARDLVVRDTHESPSDASFGVGVVIDPIGDLALTHAVLERSHDVGLLARGALAAEDVAIRGTEPRVVDGAYGFGLQVASGAEVSLDRAVLEGNVSGGILVLEASSLGARDLVIRDTRDGWCGWPCAVGLIVEEGSTAEVDRADLERNGGASLLVLGASTLTLRDAAVTDTRPVSGYDLAYGLELSDGSVVSMERTVFARHGLVGMVGFGDGTRLTLLDSVVERTAEASDGRGGTAVSMIDGAAADAMRFRFAENALCGLQLARDGVADLSLGEVSGNLIGVNVQTNGFDLNRLNDRVLYLGNDETLDASGLPLPGPGEG
jgi:hypothetical protein